MLQIAHGLRQAGLDQMKVMHPVELLDQAYRGQGYRGQGTAEPLVNLFPVTCNLCYEVDQILQIHWL